MSTLVKHSRVVAAAIAPDPLPSSILDHATVVDEKRDFFHRGDEEVQESQSHLTVADRPFDVCGDAREPLDYDTFPDVHQWLPGFTFELHAEAKCSQMDSDEESVASALSDAFARTEGRGVERAIKANRFRSRGDSDSTIVWNAPVSAVQSFTEVTLPEALAALEAYMAVHYGGVPLIHMPRAAAVMLGEKVKWVGGKAFTLLGSPVAMGGGYDETFVDQDEPFAFDLYATGGVYIERTGATEPTVLPTLPGDGLEPNMLMATQTRQYRAVIDGPIVVARSERIQ